MRNLLIVASFAATHAVSFAHGGDAGSIAGLDAAAASIRDSEGLATLTQEQRQKLSKRFVAFFEVREAASLEEYVALMQSWGGRWRVSRDDEAMRPYLIHGWHPRGADCAIKLLNGESVECDVILGIEPGGRFAHWSMPSPAREAMGHGGICVFNFGEGSAELAQAGQPVAEIIIPSVERNDGTRTIFGVRFLWEPQSGNWVPWMTHEIGEPGLPLCTQLF